jgi:putative transcriptional regulator
MKKTYKSDVFATIHETASDLHNAGLMTKHTMRHFDESCLTPSRN